MKRFVFVLFVAIWGLTMNACKETPQEPVETPPETVSAVDFDEVVIIRQVSLSQEDDEEVTITDSAVLAEISTLYTSMSLSETSEPMGHPSFTVEFKKDHSLAAKWHIDGNQTTSSSQFGLGNRKIADGKSVYDYIDEVFSSVVGK